MKQTRVDRIAICACISAHVYIGAIYIPTDNSSVRFQTVLLCYHTVRICTCDEDLMMSILSICIYTVATNSIIYIASWFGVCRVSVQLTTTLYTLLIIFAIL